MKEAISRRRAGYSSSDQLAAYGDPPSPDMYFVPIDELRPTEVEDFNGGLEYNRYGQAIGAWFNRRTRPPRPNRYGPIPLDAIPVLPWERRDEPSPAPPREPPLQPLPSPYVENRPRRAPAGLSDRMSIAAWMRARRRQLGEL